MLSMSITRYNIELIHNINNTNNNTLITNTLYNIYCNTLNLIIPIRINIFLSSKSFYMKSLPSFEKWSKTLYTSTSNFCRLMEKQNSQTILKLIVFLLLDFSIGKY